MHTMLSLLTVMQTQNAYFRKIAKKLWISLKWYVWCWFSP